MARIRDSKGRFAPRTFVSDSLTTATTAMVGSTQPGVSFVYRAPNLNFQSYYDCYDTSPLAQLLINTLPEDTVSEWREWQADDKQVNLIEQVERRINARKLIRDWQVFAALEGEAIIYVDDGTDPTKQLDPNRVGKNGLRFARVFRRANYTYGNIIADPMSEWYDHPEYYQITTEAAYISPQIHPSRVFRMLNAPSPQRETGMPALVAGMEPIKQYEAVIANTAFLVQKARTTIMKVDGLMDNVGDPVTEQQIIARYQLFKYQEGNQGLGVIDKEKEDWAAHTYQFGGLDTVIQRMQQNVAAMWGYPVTRIFDRVDGGLGNSGDSSLKAYYQFVARIQDNRIGPLIRVLDELIVRSALGNYPDDVYYNWRPLEQPNQKDIQDIGSVAANTLNTAVAGGFLSAEVAEKVFINRASETGCFPGIEAAYNEWIEGGGELEPDDEESDVLRGEEEDDTVTP